MIDSVFVFMMTDFLQRQSRWTPTCSLCVYQLMPTSGTLFVVYCGRIAVSLILALDQGGSDVAEPVARARV